MTRQSNSEPVVDEVTIADLRRVAAAANAGDRDAQMRLPRLLCKNEGVWRIVADLVARTEAMLIQQAAGDEQLLAESLRLKVAAMKAELGGNASSPLQQLLVDRIAASWLHVQIAEVALAAATNQAQADRWRRALNGANQSYMAAIRLLSDIRQRTGLGSQLERGVNSLVADATGSIKSTSFDDSCASA